MRIHRAAPVAAILLLAVAGCTPGADSDAGTSTSSTALPHKQSPIAGLTAADLRAQALAVLPGSTATDYPQPAPGFVPETLTSIGTPFADGTVLASTPGIEFYAEADGTVVYVGCSDLISAGYSPVMQFCTNLPVSGVPAGGVQSVWQSIDAGSWDHTQPFPQLTIGTFDYAADHPQTGPARSFSLSGPN
ncbi:MAG: hypothetical protein ABWZ98_09420, partial [Nakamurella sp.]